MEKTENKNGTDIETGENKTDRITHHWRIQAISRWIAFVGAIIFVVTLLGLSNMMAGNRRVEENVKLFANSELSIYNLKNVSDYMTEQARLFVITQDPVYAESYFSMVDSEYRELALLELKEVLKNSEYEDVLGRLAASLTESNSLMEYELHSMKLTAVYAEIPDEEMPKDVVSYPLTAEELAMDKQAQLDAAYHLVYGIEYRKDKAAIDSEIQAAIQLLSDKLNKEALDSTSNLRSNANHVTIFVLLMFSLLLVIFVCIAKMIVNPMKAFVKAIEEDRELDVVGSYEFQYLALTYNEMFETHKENRARLKFKAEHDTLTGLYNRRAFEDEKTNLGEVHFPIAMLMVDVDHFKEINDKYGHEMGDQALTRVADILRKSFRSDDFIARLGGDEFVVFLMHVGAKDNDMVARKVKSMNEHLQNPEDGGIPLTLSVGAAFSKDGYREELYGQADSALYRVKEGGRCGYASHNNAKGGKA